jgi:Domain of unknown function (DUF397)
MPNTDQLAWRTSTFSSNGTTCVEVVLTDTVTALRDTKHRAGGHLTLPTTHSHTFITAVKSGHFHR